MAKKIICLVGPSGSGKTAIAEQLVKDDRFEKVKTSTTREPRGNETKDSYFFLTKDEFKQGIDKGIFLEYAQYAENFYGTPKFGVDTIIENNKVAVVPIDINGANAYRKFYGDDVIVVFVYRDKKTIIETVIERQCPVSEKSKRILQLDAEFDLISQCDMCVVNNDTIENVAKKIQMLV